MAEVVIDFVVRRHIQADPSMADVLEHLLNPDVDLESIKVPKALYDAASLPSLPQGAYVLYAKLVDVKP
jgi:hypothetical protein